MAVGRGNLGSVLNAVHFEGVLDLIVGHLGQFWLADLLHMSVFSQIQA